MYSSYLHNQGRNKALFYCFLFLILSLAWAQVGLKSDVAFVILSIIISFLLLHFSNNGNDYFYVRAYLYFNLSLWIFNSALRRYADVHHGWSDLNVYSLSPILSTSVVIFFISSISIYAKKAYMLIGLMILGLIYSLFIGILKNGIFASFYAFLTWLVPLLIFLYIVNISKHYEKLMDDLHYIITVFVCVCSVYGIYQYFFLPVWDSYWITNAPMTSVGLPNAMQFRSFSFLNSPMVYAPILSMFLAFILIKESRINSLVLLLGIFSIALTFVRSSWGGTLLFGFIYLIWLSRWSPISVIRLLSVGIVFLIFLISALAGTEVGYEIYGRIESLFLLEEDTSFDARQNFYDTMLISSLTNVVGDGMGAVGAAKTLVAGRNVDTVFDSGILQLFVLLGWSGVLLYGNGLFRFSMMCIDQVMRKDKKLSIVSIIVLTMFVQLIFANRLIGPIGFFLFLFLGCLVAGRLNNEKQGSCKSV